MAYGLQIRNASNVITLDAATRYVRLHATYAMPALGGSGGWVQITVAGMVNDGTWAVVSNVLHISTQVNTGFFYLYNRWPYASGANTCYVLRL